MIDLADKVNSKQFVVDMVRRRRIRSVSEGVCEGVREGVREGVCEGVCEDFSGIIKVYRRGNRPPPNQLKISPHSSRFHQNKCQNVTMKISKQNGSGYGFTKSYYDTSYDTHSYDTHSYNT